MIDYENAFTDGIFLRFWEVRELPSAAVCHYTGASYRLLFLRQGQLLFEQRQEKETLMQGDILLLPPGTPYTVRTSQAFHMTVVQVDIAFWKQILNYWPELNYAFAQAERLGSGLLRTSYATWTGLFSLLDMAQAEKDAGDFGWQVNTQMMLTVLIMHIGRTYYYRDAVTPRMESKILGDKIIAYVDANFKEELTLQMVAEEFHVCRSTISRLFQREYHCTFHQFILRKRLVAAKNDVLKGTSLNTASLNAGFTDYACFYRSFKKMYGISPQQFKQNSLPGAE